MLYEVLLIFLILCIIDMIVQDIIFLNVNVVKKNGLYVLFLIYEIKYQVVFFIIVWMFLSFLYIYVYFFDIFLIYIVFLEIGFLNIYWCRVVNIF